MKQVLAVVLASSLLAAPVFAQTPLLGQAYPSGNTYLLLPDDAQDWPDRVVLSGPDTPPNVTALLDRVLRDVHPPTLEDTPASRGPCVQGTSAVEDAPDDGVFDRGTPDNCDPDPRVAVYLSDAAVNVGLVLGWPNQLTADTTQTGQPRPLTDAETSSLNATREAFKTDYKAAFGIEFDPETNPIGEIPTLADATILAEFTTEGTVLRLSQWDSVTPALHIYRHFLVDVIRANSIEKTFTYSRFQGFLG